MAFPYQYRDYPLAVFMAIVILISLLAVTGENDYQSVEITLPDDCHIAEDGPVVASLVRLPAARNVQRQTQEGATVISLRTHRKTSAKKIWETIEAAQCRPLRIVVDNREFVSKPID